MAVEIVEDRATSARYEPVDLPARPSSATVTLYAPGGTALESPSVALDSVSASVSSVTSQTVVVVDSATGMTPGRRVWLATADGWSGAVRIDEVAGTTITLEAAPPGTLDTSAAFYGLGLTATIAAASVDDVGLHHRLDWIITDADGTVHSRRQAAHVVKMAWTEPVTDSEAKRYVEGIWPNMAVSQTAGWFRRLAEEASERVRSKLRAGGDYPHRVGDADAFAQAGLVALRVALSHLGLVPPGMDPASYMDAQETALRITIREALANTWIDRDDDDAVDAGEVRGLYTVSLVRS